MSITGEPLETEEGRRGSIVPDASIAFQIAALPLKKQEHDDADLAEHVTNVQPDYSDEEEIEDKPHTKFHSKIAKEMCYQKFGRPTPKFMDKNAPRRASMFVGDGESLLEAPLRTGRRASDTPDPRRGSTIELGSRRASSMLSGRRKSLSSSPAVHHRVQEIKEGGEEGNGLSPEKGVAKGGRRQSLSPMPRRGSVNSVTSPSDANLTKRRGSLSPLPQRRGSSLVQVPAGRPASARGRSRREGQSEKKNCDVKITVTDTSDCLSSVEKKHGERKRVSFSTNTKH